MSDSTGTDSDLPTSKRARTAERNCKFYVHGLIPTSTVKSLGLK